MGFKTCSRCGKIVTYDHKCNDGRKINRLETDKLRNQRRWKKKAREIKEADLFLCQVCKAEGIYNYEDLEVHHIIKLRDNPNGLLDDDNLITLCRYHHKKADSGEIEADYLRELIKERGQDDIKRDFRERSHN